MALGILEPAQSHAAVPGTVKLLQEDQKHVELSPRPSDSPNDPLRWSQWKKFGVLLTVSIGCALSGIEGTILSVATGPISEEFKQGILVTETFTSYPFLSTAVSCALSAILARTLGKRPIYLAAAIFHLISSIWVSVATSYGSFLAGRIIFGLGGGTFESMGIATAGDIYFVHERGRAMGFFSFMALGCTQIAPVVAGYMTDTYGWRSIFYTLTAFKVVLLLMTFFLVPETAFNRAAKFDTDMALDKIPATPEAQSTSVSMEGDEKDRTVEQVIEAPNANEKKRSYIRELLPYRPIHAGINVWVATVQFFITGLYPIVWFAFILLASYLAWYLGIVVTLAQVFGAPPIGFGPTQLGYLNAFGLPGALLAEIILHLFADSSCRWLAKRNNNIHEPEFRLFMIIPAFIVALLAYPIYGWYVGVYALSHQISWVPASVLFGMAVFCLVQSQSVALAYLLDSHRDISIEAGLFAIMCRSFFSYGATTFVPIWIENDGVATAYYAMAGLQAGLIILVVSLMYIFGKRVRAFMHAHSPVKASQTMFGMHQ